MSPIVIFLFRWTLSLWQFAPDLANSWLGPAGLWFGVGFRRYLFVREPEILESLE